MDADDGGQGRGGTLGIVNIQQVPLSVASVGDISTFRDTLRQRDGAVTLPIAAPDIDTKQKAV
jgi:hypothetical protein